MDLIAKIGRLESDAKIAGTSGEYDMTAYSISAETGHRFMLAPSVFLEPQFEVAYGYAEGADLKTISATHQVTDSKLNSTDSLTGRIGMNSMVMLRTVVVRKPMTKTSLTHGLNTVSVATLM